MPATYESIATTSFTSATASYTFTSIPQTYTDLLLVTSLQVSVAASLRLRFNGDSGANYGSTAIYTDGTATIGAGGYTNSTSVASDALNGIGVVGSGIFSPFIFNINNYSNSTTYKTLLTSLRTTSGGYLGNGDITIAASTWRSTSAITSIELFPSNSANIGVGSTFTLYGIKAA